MMKQLRQLPKMVWVCALYVVVLIIAQFSVPMQAALEVKLSDQFLPISSMHWLGTDDYGRDLFARLIIGARYTLLVSLVTIVMTVVIGVPIGMIAGFLKGKVEKTIMRIVDIGLSIPEFVLIIAMASLLKPSIWNIVWAMVLLRWMTYTRLTRTIVASIRHMDYIRMAKLYRVPTYRMMLRHFVPHVLPSILVVATVDFGKNILYISSLSFLGLGAQPPSPEWGAMLNAGRDFMTSNPILLFAPAVMIAVTILIFQLTGDALRDHFTQEEHRGHE
ncbi:nickel transporter permease [Staphylococcus pseudintermedius]|uniref:nickel transporter permease n=1 Tax=Staphylococcus pseudintermedius TaxID=283734 RepID=UPI001C1F69F7|nr:nickel transporter permease [Staphylococcus pseudintermedius]MBU7228831.1 ABC transporter permease [Staphylococcus pseudintermedius]MCE5532664.1 ABC transporter permease [Staphylococcus pseudintermedius]MCE5644947.1 ABC transporter permease [Staphylococcus pseudintermedius]MCE5757752.1 ABC transporter permease [Staphylococcus pseudintermedius]MCE5794098.1 ABC transporter permease [Staphylococcus pseudintermedius]